MTLATDISINDWQTILNHLGSIAKRRSAMDAEEARWLREAERVEIWRKVGCPNMAAFLEQHLGYGPRVARERMRICRALATLPATDDALDKGALHYSAIRELTRVVTPATEDTWLLAAIGKNLRSVEELVRGRSPGDLPTDPPQPDVAMRTVRYDVKPPTYALLREARKAMEDAAGCALDDDAFLEGMCRSVLQPPGDGPPPAAHQMAITTCDTCKRAWQDGAGAVVEISPAALERANCDAVRIGRLDATVPTRATQDIPPATRRLVWHRDHAHCVIPGCRSARFLEIHHITYRENGGTNELANLMLCCSGHHTAIHEGHIRVTGSAPELTFSLVRPEEPTAA